MTRKRALLYALLCLALSLFGYLLAETYIDRLPNHAGYYLVQVEDGIAPAYLGSGESSRPRHAVLVVVDGLRADHAANMSSVKRLREAGQCRLTAVGPLSVSRPVYAVISTGLEQDRTGSRNNDLTAPLAADSLWQVARRGGLRVTATSELRWFQQLFPDGFSTFTQVPRSADHFAAQESELGDLALIHPLYVDESGHDFGGASKQYAAEVARADAEFSRLLARLDLSRDVVVLTADHGHTDRGGHGAGTKEVAQVLTCFAGVGIVHKLETETPTWDSRLIAPTLSVLLKLPFPRHMRAGEDRLDEIWDVVDAKAQPPAYVADRQQAVQRFREQNAAAIGRWLSHDGGGAWSELYRRAEAHQRWRALLLFIIVQLLFGVFLGWRQLPHPFPVRALFFVCTTWLLLMMVWTGLRGSFDFNSMNERAEFIRWAELCSLSTLIAATTVHYLVFRDRALVLGDYVRMLCFLALVHIMHIAAFGWPFGFPLPNPVFIFFPFIGGAFLATGAALGVLFFLALLINPRWQTIK